MDKDNYQITMWLPKIHVDWFKEEQLRLGKKGWSTIIKKRKTKYALFKVPSGGG